MSELAPEQATPEAVEPETPETPAEEWSGVSQQDFQQIQQTMQEQQEALEYLASLAQPASPFQQQQPQEPEPIQLDPLDDSFQQQMDRYIEEKLGPYTEYVQAQQYREGDARAQDIIAADVAKNGDFLFNDPSSPFGDSKARVRELANNHIVEMNQNYPGDPAKAATAALEKAAQDVRAWEEAVGKAYYDRQVNQLSTLGNARQEPGVGNGATQQFTIPREGGLVDVAYRHGQGR